MPTATYGVALSAGGVSIQKSITRSADSALGFEVTLNAAKSCVANTWVKTDANTAACNMANGHGYANGLYDTYWTGGRRYNVGVTVTVDALALEGGAGDDFPANATAVTICPQTSISAAIDGDELEIIGVAIEYADAASTKVGHLSMQDAGAGSIEEIDLTANAPVVYDITGGATNVFTGNAIASVKASHSDTTNTATVKICGVVDSTT